MRLGIVGLAFLFTVSGCKKCIECSYSFNGETYSSGETCGTKKEIEDLENKWNDHAKVVGTAATCTPVTSNP